MLGKCENCSTNEASSFFYLQGEKEDSIQKKLCTDCAKKLNLLPSSQIEKTEKEEPMQNIFSLVSNFMDNNNTTPSSSFTFKNYAAQHSSLEKFCTNLNQKLTHSSSISYIGREKEMERMIHILNRKTKNNPILIGEPGVGKTAIIEGLTKKINAGHVPQNLQNKQIYSLNPSAVLAGSAYRGQLEENMNQLIKEIIEQKNIILFIDEIHTIMGAGSTMESSSDIANILKPYLSRGEIQIIGATTLEEARILEKDKALNRRFQTIIIPETSIEETFTILQGIKDTYETHHRVLYSDDILKHIILLSKQYITDRFFPDKAIDLLDEVGSKINIANKTNLPPFLMDYKSLKETELRESSKRNYQKAMEARSEFIKFRSNLPKTHLQVIDTLEENGKEQGITSFLQTKEFFYSIQEKDVEETIAEMTGIPVTKINESDKHSLQSLEKKLNDVIIGQKEAIHTVTNAIKRQRLNLRSTKKPVTLYFTGPTGTGKTALTKQLAYELFGDKHAVIRFDMSEYMESHTISKLIGSPPGYVGHEEAGQLTEKVRRKPYSILLLDEFEKAHPKITNVFLQLFDEGRLTDSQGKTVDFTNTIIIMTSNIHTNENKTTGFVASPKQASTDALEKHFSKEFINRIDSIVHFRSLEVKDAIHIVDIHLQDLIRGLAAKKITCSISYNAKLYVAKKGYSSVYGARPLQRMIVNEIEVPIANALLEKDEVSSISIELENDSLVFQVK